MYTSDMWRIVKSLVELKDQKIEDIVKQDDVVYIKTDKRAYRVEDRPELAKWVLTEAIYCEHCGVYTSKPIRIERTILDS